MLGVFLDTLESYTQLSGIHPVIKYIKGLMPDVGISIRNSEQAIEHQVERWLPQLMMKSSPCLYQIP